MWYQKFDRYIQGLGLVRSKVNHYVYYKQVGENFIYVVLYVDDMLLVENNMKVMKEVKMNLSSKLAMKDLSASNLIMGMEIKINSADRKLSLNQRKYFETILHRFNMQECKLVKVPVPVGIRISTKQCPKTQEEKQDMSHVPYASVVGRLMYAMVCTRPDISHAVGVSSKYMPKQRKEHWTVLKRVFKYLRGTTGHEICYQGISIPDRVLDVHGFIDVGQDRYLDHRRSTSGYVFNLFGGALSWMRKKQAIVALSTIEVEYMATTHASKEDVWLQRLCSYIGFKRQAMRIDHDIQSAIFLEMNTAYHSKMKNIDVQYHFVKDMVECKKVSVDKVNTFDNVADSLTKFVGTKKFSWCT